MSFPHDSACRGGACKLQANVLPANITLRLASLGDADEIALLSRDLIETGLGWTWTAARVARNIASSSTVTVVACAQQRSLKGLVGFAIMYFGDEHAHLNLLAVRPDWQRAGIGRHLVGWLEESALVAGLATIRLELRATNRAARRFYARLGFAEVARVPEYYGGVETAVRMTRDIRRGASGPAPDVRTLLKR
jgi:ribosomal-protein-alanine N-acetyltransferase